MEVWGSGDGGTDMRYIGVYWSRGAERKRWRRLPALEGNNGDLVRWVMVVVDGIEEKEAT